MDGCPRRVHLHHTRGRDGLLPRHAVRNAPAGGGIHSGCRRRCRCRCGCRCRCRCRCGCGCRCEIIHDIRWRQLFRGKESSRSVARGVTQLSCVLFTCLLIHLCMCVGVCGVCMCVCVSLPCVQLLVLPPVLLHARQASRLRRHQCQSDHIPSQGRLKCGRTLRRQKAGVIFPQ